MNFDYIIASNRTMYNIYIQRKHFLELAGNSRNSKQRYRLGEFHDKINITVFRVCTGSAGAEKDHL